MKVHEVDRKSMHSAKRQSLQSFEMQRQSSKSMQYLQPSVKSQVDGDYLNLCQNSYITSWLCPNEKIMFSFSVMKKNRFKIWQRRSVMLTTENLVNLRNKDTNLQRVIKVSKLTGLTKS